MPDPSGGEDAYSSVKQKITLEFTGWKNMPEREIVFLISH